VLTEEMIQFDPPATNASAFQNASRRAFLPLVFLGRAAIFSHIEEDYFQDGLPVGWPRKGRREGTAVRWRRVGTTQAYIGRVSRRSESTFRRHGFTAS
jgi:hypothetical protein